MLTLQRDIDVVRIDILIVTTMAVFTAFVKSLLLLLIQIPISCRCCSLEVSLRSNAAVRLCHLPGHFRVQS